MKRNDIREKRIQAAKKFGRVDSKGQVFLQLGKNATDGEKFVGQYLTGEIDNEMTLYVTRFVDTEEKIDLFVERLKSDINVTSPTIDKSINSFKLFAETKNAIGDYLALTSRIEEVFTLGEETKVANAQKRKELIETSLQELNSLVLAIEAEIKEDASKIIWKKAVLAVENGRDQWDKITKNIHLPDKQRNELWARFKSAKDTIYQGRKEFNDKFRKITDDVKAKKRILIEEAEKIKDHEDLEYARKEFSNLMNRWKKISSEIGKGRKLMDEKQWADFKSIQDYFYSRLPKVDPAAKRKNDDSANTAEWKEPQKLSTNVGDRLSSGSGSSFEDLMKLKAELENK